MEREGEVRGFGVERWLLTSICWRCTSSIIPHFSVRYGLVLWNANRLKQKPMWRRSALQGASLVMLMISNFLDWIKREMHRHSGLRLSRCGPLYSGVG
jgi:hypothetical protein